MQETFGRPWLPKSLLKNPVPCNKAQTKIAFLDGLVNMKLN